MKDVRNTVVSQGKEVYMATLFYLLGTFVCFLLFCKSKTIL